MAALSCELTPQLCLLGLSVLPKKCKLTVQFLKLALVLARRQFAITWMQARAPSEELWVRDVSELAVAEETQMRCARFDAKLPADLDVSGLLCQKSLDRGDECQGLLHGK
ncbi:hypothetical protein NDU88_008244 [Pleurodeles waltl]|uniref:Uncharacterized protein n=1 Tax=Pleurodeles waltl TaxID=8319 RepID=A0AAV7NVY3_PLEWA|nr:hypothetical protein NDU88_008244 [Pleurodeles waltl]